MTQKKVREWALDLLLQVEEEKAYSNLLLNETINKSQLNQKDIGLLTELVYGTIQRKMSLNYFLTPFVKDGLETIEVWVKTLLQMSLYQMVYLDKIPERAVIHEAVDIARKKGHEGIGSFVNGVLRSVQRQGVPTFDSIKNENKRLAIQYSTPKWLVRRWIEQFGVSESIQIMEESLKPPHVTIRVNAIKTNREQLMEQLEKEGVLTVKGELSPDALIVKEGQVFSTSAYKDGLFTAQDESSMLVARALSPNEDDHVLDACAAPGGKSTHLAERMNNKGKVLAIDLHEHKVRLISNQSRRLQLSIVEAVSMDVRELINSYQEQSFDKILVDAPCTGFGVLKRKPDIKWSKKEQDIVEMSKIQASILDKVAPLLKKGGQLVYSTCTIDQEENELQMKSFLQKNSDFTWDETLEERMPEKLKQTACNQKGRLLILPQDFQTDGFFIASLLKR
ncbi:16S rRNA (cytosine(967)-C(5))-methyltransferase RsmB [Alkalihalobacillus trypoxylicola]|uniref:16S rRNA (cytosine(967)-C(5))-methyltransferase n=1 Tax=Alkalihalobacillus trypoxylicola TaxID=519424 RepID=A0A162FA44_9BACI|nr:16S rRNA (cytosine(967)-C(5))-methyltransferase RsmB [Alkalihalobacillus trypoxylicola]KYG35131.1 16S rRNA methyltransferase [Alkalihalobacillus trypoxylicola]